VPEVEDDDPSDILRRVQAGMSAARLSVPIDEQIEIVGEHFYAKEIRKLFRECGMPITAAGHSLVALHSRTLRCNSRVQGQRGRG